MQGDESSEKRALTALRNVDFDWAAQVHDIWADDGFDVPDLHGEIRQEFSQKLKGMRDDGRKSPLGWMLCGSGGVGKTHLLGALRREATRQDAGFVLVDMTDVRDFWGVVLQGYLDSLQTIYRQDEFQYQFLLTQFIGHVSKPSDIQRNLQILATRKTKALARDVQNVVQALRRKHPREALDFQDVIRALICLNSEDLDVAATGYAWLQGQEIEDEFREALGFRTRQKPPRETVRALSWFMSLSGPAVVAFDQLDPIVQQVFGGSRREHAVEESAEEGTARSIIGEISNGLAAMPGTTFNTLTIVSCVESTLGLLRELTLGTNLHRFEPTRNLVRAGDADIHRMVIAERLRRAYRRTSFDPPYETWPFHDDAIKQLGNASVRELLKLCDQHRRSCLLAGAVSEIHRFSGDNREEVAESVPAAVEGFAGLEQRFGELKQTTDVIGLLDEKEDDERLAPLYRTALQCLIHEHELQIPAHVDTVVEQNFSGGRKTVPLHARLRIVDHKNGSREEHYCLRAIQRRHAGAYKARLKAALTQSGVDTALKFRHLVIIRSYDCPGGKLTQELTKVFREAGGCFHHPGEEELRTLSALHELRQTNDPLFLEWLRKRRPVTGLGLREVLADAAVLRGHIGNDAPGGGSPSNNPLPRRESAASVPAPAEPEPEPVSARSAARRPGTPPPLRDVAPEFPATDSVAAGAPSPAAESEPQSAPEPKTVAAPPAEIPMGCRVTALESRGDAVSLPLTAFTRHTIILGGSGSGKSVTLRRIIEESVLAGIPSVIVDCAQDMCLFDKSWDDTPEGWEPGDEERARQFQDRVEQIVWTPGSLSSGNPLSLRPLPDFTAIKDDAEELEDALVMACNGLKEIVASGRSRRAKDSFGVLKHSLEYFAKRFPNRGLDGYIDLLGDLPPEARLGIGNEEKIIEAIASSLRVEQTTNPLLKGVGSPLDPAVLFGDDQQRDTVRLSVISLVKLKGQEAHQSFLNQLAMELFAWIKQHPSPPGQRPLRGLLVIDEARDFVPSQRTTECKESMMRLAAQARKYRLGLVFATQHPKDIETRIVGNCATHLYGLNNSPASLATLQDLMAQKGGSGKDIPRLKAGQFYIHNADAGVPVPVKIQVPMSLSYSPDNPLEEREILRKAEDSARALHRK